MKVVRNKIFETNSSSTHSIVVDYGAVVDIERPIEISPWWSGEFGWQWDTWYLPDEKMAYVIRCALSGMAWDADYDIHSSDGYEKVMQMIQERFDKIGVHFIIPSEKAFDDGYVDHENEYWFSDIKDIYEDDDQLLQFIFGERSYIEGGNDNG